MIRRRNALLTTLASLAGAPLGGAMLASCGPSVSQGMLSEAPLVVRPAPNPPAVALPPVRLPEDEAPHDTLAEWWYYTGHLYAAGTPSQEYGFELVFFRGVRGDRPPGYAAHFAVTDLPRGLFAYDQRQDVALNERGRPAVRPSGASARPAGVVSFGPAGGGFDLALGGWSMRSLGGQDSLVAEMPGYRLAVDLAETRPPALHQGTTTTPLGLISFGQAGYSYYYSRTRMDLHGTLAVAGGPPLVVDGLAWMDHQWGEFLVLGGGGWDWFAGNLADGRDLTISIVRDERGTTVLAYGTLVETSGESRHLPPGSFSVEAVGMWASPHTRIRYPAGWRVRIPDAGLDLRWTPLLPDQELDTRASTGVIYWEGAVSITDDAGVDAGRGYVELTGYAA